MKLATLLSIFLLTITGCSTSIDPEKYLEDMNIKLKGDYEILSRNSSAAIGDYLVEFELKLGESDFENVVNSIENHRTYKILDSLETYPSGLGSYPNHKIKEYACYRNGTYYMNLFIPDTIGTGWEDYTFYLQEDSTLNFQYADE